MTRKYTSLPYTEYTVATGNFDKSRKPITQIIIHSTVSTYESAISWFGNPKAGTSAHYVVGNKGQLAALLEEYYTAFHSGNYNTNQSSIGIEHEWYTGITPSNELYKTAAKLVYDICTFYKLGINRGVIKAHNEIVPTKCPNQIDIDRIVREAQALAKPLIQEDKDKIITDLKGTIEVLEKQLQDKDKQIKETSDNAARQLEKQAKTAQLMIDQTKKEYKDKINGLTNEILFIVEKYKSLQSV